MDDAQYAVTGSNQVGTDAEVFYADTSSFVADISPYLAPDWQAEPAP